MLKNNQLIWKYVLLIMWCIIFIIYLIQIIGQKANTWWLPWLWEVASLTNICVLFKNIRTLK